MVKYNKLILVISLISCIFIYAKCLGEDRKEEYLKLKTIEFECSAEDARLMQFSTTGNYELLLRVNSLNSDDTFTYQVYDLVTSKLYTRTDNMDMFSRSKQQFIFDRKYEFADKSYDNYKGRTLSLIERVSGVKLWSIHDSKPYFYRIFWQDLKDNSKLIIISNSDDAKNKLVVKFNIFTGEKLSETYFRRELKYGYGDTLITDDYKYLVFIKNIDTPRGFLIANVLSFTNNTESYEFSYNISIQGMTYDDCGMIMWSKVHGNTIIIAYSGGTRTALIPRFGIVIYDVATHQLLLHKQLSSMSYNNAFQDAAISSDGKYIALQNFKKIELYTLQNQNVSENENNND